MSRTEQQGNFCQISDVKSSQTFEKKNSIENLSNEIFYEIFDYLDGYDIYKAFSNLNIRLDNLLINSSFHMKIECSSTTTIDCHYEQFIRSNKHNIISFYFDDQVVIDKFIAFFPIDLLFTGLQSVVLHQILPSQLFLFLFYLKSLPHLSSLGICLDYYHGNLGHIYQLIFRLSLKYLRLEILDYEGLVVTLPIATPDRYSSIKYLVIGHVCTFNKLTDILSYTPQLSHLYCYYIGESDDNIDFKVLIKLTNLVHLKLTLYVLCFDEFESFLVKLCSQLQLLSVTIEDSEKCFLDADRWEYLVLQHMTHLKKFIFCYTDIINTDLQISPSHSLINRFTTLFWINRKWILKISLKMNEFVYSIRPYKESWMDFEKCLHINQDSINDCANSSDSYLQMIEFIVDNLFLTEKNESLLYKMTSILDMIKITCLDIHCEKMSVKMLIKFLKALPNLNSIRISDLPLHKPMELCLQDVIILNKFFKINKIMKLTLRTTYTIEQIDLMIDLFPRLQYFGLEDVLDGDLQRFVRCILLNIKQNNICHPMMICIVSVDAKYDQLETLHQIIDSENLLTNYKIYRQLNRFYLQWN